MLAKDESNSTSKKYTANPAVQTSERSQSEESGAGEARPGNQLIEQKSGSNSIYSSENEVTPRNQLEKLEKLINVNTLDSQINPRITHATKTMTTMTTKPAAAQYDSNSSPVGTNLAQVPSSRNNDEENNGYAVPPGESQDTQSNPLIH